MKTFMFLVLLGTGVLGATAVTHSMKYFYTASSQVSNFPEFVVVGLVDEEQMVYYDSNTQKAEPKQDWMNKVTEDNPQYLETEAGNFLGQQQTHIANIDIVKDRFNQTGGVHIVQWMYGCEWDDETGKVTGFEQNGYDGEDFLSFDFKTETWIAAQQAVITKNRRNQDKAYMAQRKNYFTQICPEWGKKYVNYGRSSLMRTELPSVSLLQKTSSSPVTCHATGFYPDRASLVWKKDGVELHENVDHGEIVPNHDGTFQMSIDLKPDASEDWSKYDCVFQLAGVEEDIVTKLDKKAILTNEQNLMMTGIIVAVVVLALAIAGIVGLICYRQKKAKRPPSPVSGSEVMEELNPKA